MHCYKMYYIMTHPKLNFSVTSYYFNNYYNNYFYSYFLNYFKTTSGVLP